MSQPPGQSAVSRSLPHLEDAMADMGPRQKAGLAPIVELARWWAMNPPERVNSDISSWYKTHQASRDEDIVELEGKARGGTGVNR